MDVEQTLLKEARRRAGEPPAGHTKDCSCPECIGLKARALDIADEMAEGVLADLRDFREHEAEWERTVARRQTVAEAREVAAGAGQVRAKLQTSLEGHLRRAATIVANADGERMSDSQYQAFSRASTRAAELAEQDRALEGLEARAVAVVNESRVYGPQSPNSWFLDMVLRADFNAEVSGPARARAERYAAELAYEARRRSPEGQRVLRALHEKTRQLREDLHREAESRGVGTDGGISATAAGEAAALVSPYFIEAEWAPYRGKARSFADQCGTWPMPPYGLKLYVPYFSSAASAGEQTEGQEPSGSSPTTALQGATLETVSGQIVVSQQIHDRAMTGGGAFDIVCGKQINQQLEEAVDLYVLNQAINNGKSVAGQSSYTTAHLYQDIALAREELTDTAGTRLRPTHFFTTSDLYSYATRQTDEQARPILVPQFAAGFPISNGADGGAQDGSLPKWSRFTGTVLPGGVLWFENDNIPTYGTTSQTQLVISAPDEAILLCESDEPILTSFPETDATHLQVLVNSRKYVAAVTRHASGSAAITSAAYKTTLV